MNIEKPEDLIGKTLGKYEVVRYIASGSFGHVYEGKHTRLKRKVALKVPVKNNQKDGSNSLTTEARVYSYLSDANKGIANVKTIKVNGTPIMVMDLLGKSIEALLRKYCKFKLQTIVSLAIKMIDICRHIHSYGYIHRDLKPDNFVIGCEDPTTLYCIDFGLARKYVKHNEEHIDFSKGKRFVGTARYASVNAHKGQEQSRRDDLESIGYILVYMFKGKLPWQSAKHPDKKKRYEMIKKAKESISLETLCSNMPREFLKYFYYVKSLDFDEKPHYTALKKMFQRLLSNMEQFQLEWIESQKLT